MQLIIIYDKTFVLNNVEDNIKIINLKKLIEEKYHIPSKLQTLQYSGKLLQDDKFINDFDIKNNSFIFLNTRLDGGTISGFPDVGHLAVLLGFSTVFLLLSYYFFYNIMNSINIIQNQKKCRPLEDVESNLDANSALGSIMKYKDKLSSMLTKGTGKKKTITSKKRKEKNVKTGSFEKIIYNGP